MINGLVSHTEDSDISDTHTVTLSFFTDVKVLFLQVPSSLLALFYSFHNIPQDPHTQGETFQYGDRAQSFVRAREADTLMNTHMHTRTQVSIGSPRNLQILSLALVTYTLYDSVSAKNPSSFRNCYKQHKNIR